MFIFQVRLFPQLMLMSLTRAIQVCLSCQFKQMSLTPGILQCAKSNISSLTQTVKLMTVSLVAVLCLSSDTTSSSTQRDLSSIPSTSVQRSTSSKAPSMTATSTTNALLASATAVLPNLKAWSSESRAELVRAMPSRDKARQNVKLGSLTKTLVVQPSFANAQPSFNSSLTFASTSPMPKYLESKNSMARKFMPRTSLSAIP